MGNNPINGVDPDGENIYYFDENGNISNIVKQSWLRNLFLGHTGIMADGIEFHISNHIAKHLYKYEDFSYSLLNEDTEANFGIITNVETKESLERNLDFAIANFKKYNYLPGMNLRKAFIESINMGKLDFSEIYKYRIPKLTIIPTLKGLEAQNAHNIGNFLTGAAFERLGIGIKTGRIAAHLHAIIYQKHPLGDSTDDQKMLYEGWSWSRGYYINY